MTKICLSCGNEIPENSEDNMCEDCRNIAFLERICGKVGVEFAVVSSGEELSQKIQNVSTKNSPIFIDTSNCGSQLKVKFYKIVNDNGKLYAQIEVIYPRKVMYNGKIVDLTKLNDFSKYDKGIFVGVEQEHKDSLYVANNKSKIFPNGHIGYLKLFDLLSFSEQDEDVRKLLDVDKNWDAEWTEEDIVN